MQQQYGQTGSNKSKKPLVIVAVSVVVLLILGLISYVVIAGLGNEDEPESQTASSQSNDDPVTRANELYDGAMEKFASGDAEGALEDLERAREIYIEHEEEDRKVAAEAGIALIKDRESSRDPETGETQNVGNEEFENLPPGEHTLDDGSTILIGSPED